jgi:hypothetical protein
MRTLYQTEVHKPTLPRPAIHPDQEPSLIGNETSRHVVARFPLPDNPNEWDDFCFHRTGHALLELDRVCEVLGRSERKALRKKFIKFLELLEVLQEEIKPLPVKHSLGLKRNPKKP